MISSVLFDLDGTLTDTTEGIVRSMQYALGRLGRPQPDETELRGFISASIHPTFVKLLNTNNEAIIEEGIRFFRERYSETGLFENRVYPGIPELLAELHQNNFGLYVVTSKAKVYAERMIIHSSLGQWLGDIFGPSLEERQYTKAKLIEMAITTHKLIAEQTVMVGDRKEDILAGKSNGTVTIGVTYGSGSQDEIARSTPDYICHSPHDIQRILISH
jgi:phosphoglycolate phosphatase